MLSGRDRDLAQFEILVDRAQRGLTSRSIVFTGLRGVGKTVLLNELAATARARGWIVAQVEVEHTSVDEFARSISRQFTQAARRRRGWLDKTKSHAIDALRTLAAFNVTVQPDGAFTFGLNVEPGRADSGALQGDLPDLAEALAEAANEDGVGVVLFIDEMQELDEIQMSAVCRACHRAGQQQLPFYVVGAGLPNLAAALADAESYAERLFEYREIDRLSDPAAREALVTPAAQAGATIDGDAATFLLDESRGYPYFIQQFGKSTWDAAVNDDTITFDDAVLGVAEGQALLDVGLYRSRWERATPTERAMLGAIAVDGEGPAAIGEVASRLGKSTTAISPARAQLISKGIIYAPERGQIAFTVPGMADYVRRLDNDA